MSEELGEALHPFERSIILAEIRERSCFPYGGVKRIRFNGF